MIAWVFERAGRIVWLTIIVCSMSMLASCGDGGEGASSEESATREAGQQETAAEENPLGEPRDDLERFYGVYGSDDQPGRDFFVTKAKYGPGVDRTAPEGYMMIGAMWGDVAPWFMKSLSATEFEQAYASPGQEEPLRVEFQLDGDTPVAMSFTQGFEDRGRLKRIDDLPEDW